MSVVAWFCCLSFVRPSVSLPLKRFYLNMFVINNAESVDLTTITATTSSIVAVTTATRNSITTNDLKNQPGRCYAMYLLFRWWTGLCEVFELLRYRYLWQRAEMLGTAVGPIFLEVFSLDFVFAIIYACLHAEKKVVCDFAARHK